MHAKEYWYRRERAKSYDGSGVDSSMIVVALFMRVYRARSSSVPRIVHLILEVCIAQLLCAAFSLCALVSGAAVRGALVQSTIWQQSDVEPRNERGTSRGCVDFRMREETGPPMSSFLVGKILHISSYTARWRSRPTNKTAPHQIKKIT